MNEPPADPDVTLYAYEGEISLPKSEEMFETVRKLAATDSIPRSAFRAFLELVQNIRLHGGAKGCVTLVRRGEEVIVQARNPADGEAIVKVRESAAYANLHAGNIASVMREIRKAPLPNGANGAGLGLFELRRLAMRDIVAAPAATEEGNSELVITVTLKHKFLP